MRLEIHPATSVLNGSYDFLNKVHEHFSFIDKGAEQDLRRFNKGCIAKEKAKAINGEELGSWYFGWKSARIAELKSKIKVYCCTLKETSLDIPTGLIPRLLDEFKGIEVVDKRDWDLDRKLLTGYKPTLRKPQQEALDILTGDRPKELQGLGLIRMATGCGKTALAQELIRKLGVKSIFLVPSVSILNQTVRRFEEAFGKKYVESFGDGKKKLGYVTVATYQSVNLAPPGTFDEVRLAIGDEAHHTASDTFYDVMQNKLKHAIYRVGLSAHELRADNATMLVEAAVGPVVYKYEAKQAIEDGFLAKPTFIIYDVQNTEGKWTKYKTKDNKRLPIGEFPSTAYDGPDEMIAYRNWVLGNDPLNHFVAQLTQGFVDKGKSVLILVDEKEHGDRLLALLPGAGFAIGGGKDNELLQRDFNKRKLKILIGTSCLSEGSDLVPVDVLIELQGGASYSKTLQADGRALRNEVDDEGVARKPKCLIIDFNFPHCGILSRHSEMREEVHKTMGEVLHVALNFN